VSTIEEKVALKEILSSLVINEQGFIPILNITKRLKQEPTIMPSDYMPIIKELDKSGSGMVDAKDLLKFFDIYSKKNALSCILDLKYMANFLEFKAQNRSTRTFLQQNS
jgi:Ca2+-binding EF-hand superfamily protein